MNLAPRKAGIACHFTNLHVFIECFACENLWKTNGLRLGSPHAAANCLHLIPQAVSKSRSSVETGLHPCESMMTHHVFHTPFYQWFLFRASVILFWPASTGCSLVFALRDGLQPVNIWRFTGAFVVKRYTFKPRPKICNQVLQEYWDFLFVPLNNELLAGDKWCTTRLLEAKNISVMVNSVYVP